MDCIGPAAENQVWYSNLLCNMRSSFNKTGVGTILGSKNVKAIAVKGTKPIKVADPRKLKHIATRITERLIGDPELRNYRDFGSPYFSMPGFPYEEFIERIAKRHYACPSCPVSCKHVIHLKDEDNGVLSYRVSHLAALAWHNRRSIEVLSDSLGILARVNIKYTIFRYFITLG